jgi:hypothetical protein
MIAKRLDVLAEQVARPKVCVRLRLNKKIIGILRGA